VYDSRNITAFDVVDVRDARSKKLVKLAIPEAYIAAARQQISEDVRAGGTDKKHFFAYSFYNPLFPNDVRFRTRDMGRTPSD
jgi:hypothetical protein